MGESGGNFEFLAGAPRLLRLARLAERYFVDDPPGALLKLRALGEFMAKEIAARHGLLPASTVTFDDALRALKARAILPRQVADMFYHLKQAGNAAAHEDRGTSSEALLGLRIARADRIEAARARGLLDRLEGAILAKAFRGELVPQDPNDEPASVLLERMRRVRSAAPKPRRARQRGEAVNA